MQFSNEIWQIDWVVCHFVSALHFLDSAHEQHSTTAMVALLVELFGTTRESIYRPGQEPSLEGKSFHPVHRLMESWNRHRSWMPHPCCQATHWNWWLAVAFDEGVWRCACVFTIIFPDCSTGSCHHPGLRKFDRELMTHGYLLCLTDSVDDRRSSQWMEVVSKQTRPIVPSWLKDKRYVSATIPCMYTWRSFETWFDCIFT